MPKKTFRQTHHVSFRDCDPAALVFYPRYYEMFDTGTERMFRSLGLPWDQMQKTSDFNGLPLLETSAQYHKPAKLGDALEVLTWAEEWREKVVIMRHEIRRGEDLLVEGREVRVWALRAPDRPAGIKAGKIPEDVPPRFEE